jgi:predicted ArsR family transcriptional regulator
MADATVSAAGLKIVKLLVGNPPYTVSDLIEATGVTRTAVTEQLNDLVSLGFVEQGAERLPGRGRPRFLYKATDSALMLLFSANQQLLVSAIWKSIADVGGEELKNRVRKKVSRIMAEHYSGKITAKRPEDRLRQLMKIFIDEGGIMESLSENGQVVWYKRSCPFISMVDHERTICQIDLDMMSQVVGRPVRRTACRHEGDPCCRVEIAK